MNWWQKCVEGDREQREEGGERGESDTSRCSNPSLHCSELCVVCSSGASYIKRLRQSVRTEVTLAQTSKKHINCHGLKYSNANLNVICFPVEKSCTVYSHTTLNAPDLVWKVLHLDKHSSIFVEQRDENKLDPREIILLRDNPAHRQGFRNSHWCSPFPNLAGIPEVAASKNWPLCGYRNPLARAHWGSDKSRTVQICMHLSAEFLLCNYFLRYKCSLLGFGSSEIDVHVYIHLSH